MRPYRKAGCTPFTREWEGLVKGRGRMDRGVYNSGRGWGLYDHLNISVKSVRL